jgi:pyruvate dehydrogenase (quinone)
MSQTVADVLVNVLGQIGVRQLFGLIGDSLNPLADSVRRSKIEWIGVRHEEGAALAASGQAKFTGQLAGLRRHDRSLRGESRSRASAGIIRRNAAQGIDYIQATEPDLLFCDVARYTETMSSAAQAAGVFHQAGHLQARSSGTTWPRGDPPFHFMEISHADDT